MDVLPALVSRKSRARIVVATIASHYCYVMSAGGEFGGEIREVLCRRDHIGVETLIKKQKSQPENLLIICFDP